VAPTDQQSDSRLDEAFSPDIHAPAMKTRMGCGVYCPVSMNTTVIKNDIAPVWLYEEGCKYGEDLIFLQSHF
jgi:hypothetical protein